MSNNDKNKIVSDSSSPPIASSQSVDCVRGMVSEMEEALSGAVAGMGGIVTDAVTGMGGAVAFGVSQVTNGVGGAVSSITSGVSDVVTPMSHKMLRCLTQPPQTLVLDTRRTGSINESDEATAEEGTAEVPADLATPRNSTDSDFSSSYAVASAELKPRSGYMGCPSEGDEDSSSLQEEDVSICQELGLTGSVLDGDKSEVCARLALFEGRLRELVLDALPRSSRRRALVHALVATREHIQKVSDMNEMASCVGGVAEKGHLLLPERQSRRFSCDVCTHTIWNIITPAYHCSACRLHVHWSCIRFVRRYCPSSYFSSSPVTSPLPTDNIVFNHTSSAATNTSDNCATTAVPQPISRVRSASAYVECSVQHTVTNDRGTPCDEVAVEASPAAVEETVAAETRESLTDSSRSCKSTESSNRESPLQSMGSKNFSSCTSTPIKSKTRGSRSIQSLESLTLRIPPLDGRIVKCSLGKPLPLSSLITQICPEVGLDAQDFRCAECAQVVTNRSAVEPEAETTAAPSLLSCVGGGGTASSGLSMTSACLGATDSYTNCAWSEPRLCHYSGLHYCPACHWNNTAVLPALVIRNWDFTERPVSRASYQLLRYCRLKPLLDLNRLNPHLFVLMQELCEVKKLREDLLLMKQYLVSCRTAVESRLLRRLSSRNHFVDSAHIYSLQDLFDLNSGTLLLELQAVHKEFAEHIMRQCLVCQGRGHICLNCQASDDVIYPFEQRAVQCSVCYSVMHVDCYALERTCARCILQGREGGVTIIGAMSEVTVPVRAGKTKEGKRSS